MRMIRHKEKRKGEQPSQPTERESKDHGDNGKGRGQSSRWKGKRTVQSMEREKEQVRDCFFFIELF